jgi:small subunit ribosomal protein S4e
MAPKSWPIYRKGTKYVVRPRMNVKKGVPVLIVLRDILKIVQNRKEAKRAIHMNQVLLNNKPVNDEKNSILLFDIITLTPLKKSYRLELSENKKIEVNEIKEKESDHKIAKIIGKKILKGKKVQLNLSDGRNFLSDIKCNINDSVLINFKEKKIEKCIPLKENSEAFVFAGKHAGEKGTVKKIYKEKKMAELKVGKGSTNVLIEHLMVVNKND